MMEPISLLKFHPKLSILRKDRMLHTLKYLIPKKMMLFELKNIMNLVLIEKKVL